MKNYKSGLVFVTSCAFLALVNAGIGCAAEIGSITAAVMDLEAKEGVSAGMVSTISDYLRTELVNTKKFTIVTRENMEAILKEQKLQMSGCTSQECLVEVGQLLGVRKMFTGSIGKVGAIYLVNLKIIDVQFGKIDDAQAEQANSEERLLPAIKNLALRMAGLATKPLAEVEVAPQPSARVALVPQSRAKPVSPGQIGVYISNITDKFAKSFSLTGKEGALVIGVFRNSPAEKSGIKRGDVIIGYNDKKVKDTSELVSILRKTLAGEKIPAEILRSGKEIAVEFVMEEALPEESSSNEKFGLTVLTTKDGVLITGIKEGTFAGNTEINVGDLIKKINDEEIKYVSDFNPEINKTGISARLSVERGNTTTYVTVSKIEKVGIGVFFPFQELQTGNYIPGFTLKFPGGYNGGPRFDFIFKPVTSVEFGGINYSVTDANLIDINFFGADFWFTKGPVIPYISIVDNFRLNFGTQTIGSYKYYKMGLSMQGKLGLEVVLDSIGFFAEGGGGFNLGEEGQYKNSSNVVKDFDAFFSTGYYLLNFGTNFYF